MAQQDRQGVRVKVGVAIVEGQDDRVARQSCGACQVGVEIAKGDGVIPVPGKPVHLSLEIGRRDRKREPETVAKIMVDPDVVVHEDRHVDEGRPRRE